MKEKSTLEKTFDLLQSQIALRVATDLQESGNVIAAAGVLDWMDKNDVK